MTLLFVKIRKLSFQSASARQCAVSVDDSAFVVTAGHSEQELVNGESVNG